MKVAIINRSDSLGGAAVVAHRLASALQAQGAEVDMLVLHHTTTDPAVHTVGGKWRNRYNFVAERLGVMAHNGMNRATLFQIDPATHGLNLAKHPVVAGADVIVLHWINQGMLSLRSVQQLADTGKPIVWVMHDMWNCTGVCHHAGTCTAFEDTCQSCPLLGSTGSDLSTSTQRRKRALYKNAGIQFVAVSHWLEQKCKASSLMSDQAVCTIANAFPTTEFIWQRTDGFAPGKKVLVMGAARLDDQVKGFDRLIEVTRKLKNDYPEVARQVHLVTYGSIKDASLLDQIEIEHTHLGTISNVNEVMRGADVVLSTSRYETLPTTLIEGLASGCLAVTFGAGGQSDIVDHEITGYIAASGNVDSFVRGIVWAVAQQPNRQRLHDAMVRRFDSSQVARRHLELYELLLAKKK